jgi:hypothetical protein
LVIDRSNCFFHAIWQTLSNKSSCQGQRCVSASVFL